MLAAPLPPAFRDFLYAILWPPSGLRYSFLAAGLRLLSLLLQGACMAAEEPSFPCEGILVPGHVVECVYLLQ